jgi:hypothetical protein
MERLERLETRDTHVIDEEVFKTATRLLRIFHADVAPFQPALDFSRCPDRTTLILHSWPTDKVLLTSLARAAGVVNSVSSRCTGVQYLVFRRIPTRTLLFVYRKARLPSSAQSHFERDSVCESAEQDVSQQSLDGMAIGRLTAFLFRALAT